MEERGATEIVAAGAAVVAALPAAIQVGARSRTRSPRSDPGGRGYAASMDSPEHQRRVIVDYFLSQSPDGMEVHHAEKVSSEAVYGYRHDVWDVDTTDGVGG